ncbi:hypothetical protein ACE1CB_01460, partial [Aerosakkonema sp. BLCC-F2]
ERFCTFAREPEQRKVGIDARISVEAVSYEVDPDLAGETVILWWGLFDAVEPFDLLALASLSDKFSGAEIEAAILDGMYEAFYHNEQLTTQHIARCLSSTVPLASIAAEQIDSLKLWAARSGAKSASIDYHLSLELKQMASKFQHPLEDPLKNDKL